MKIETYSLYEFCQEVQEAVLSGWRFDFESNDNFPTAFGSMLVAGMKLAEVPTEVPTGKAVNEQITDSVTQAVQPEEVKQETKRGRKAKE